MALMAVGDFVFEAGATSYEKMRHMRRVRWPAQERIRAPLARQFLGPGEQNIQIDGTLFPDSDMTSGPEMLDSLARAGMSGETFMVVGGDGEVFGRYVLEELGDVRTYLNEDGSGRKVEFNITLQEYGGSGGFSGILF